MEKFIETVVLSVGVVVLLIATSFFLCFPTMWSWNYVMPYLFGMKEITVWHAFSLNVLAGMLIKSTLNVKK